MVHVVIQLYSITVNYRPRGHGEHARDRPPSLRLRPSACAVPKSTLLPPAAFLQEYCVERVADSDERPRRYAKRPVEEAARGPIQPVTGEPGTGEVVDGELRGL